LTEGDLGYRMWTVRRTLPLMQTRCQHRQEVTAFLQSHLSNRRWELALPSSGRGQETYVAQSNDSRCFVKLGAHIPRYEAMASLDLTPAIIASGYLRDGTSVLVETYIEGRNPSWHDFRHLLPRMAGAVNTMHHSPALRGVLPAVASETYREAGLGAARRVQDKWALYRAQVPAVADYVDEALAALKQAIQGFAGCGLVASHNDICNGNWLIALDGRIYLVDLEAMCLDDPAHDMGSLLWWYYPPELRPRFLTRAGYQYDEAFQNRMRVRMALHCLDILLPRPGSFDRFRADTFADELADLRAVVAGRDNPQGYGA
jgi:thiamine kinase-like enzyme